MTRCSYPDVQAANPGRSPSWRWWRASALLKAGSYYSPFRDDVATGRALKYLRSQFSSADARYRRKLRRGLDDVAAAHELAGGPQGVRLEVEARILARQTAEQISRRVGVPADVLRTYEALFFDVADRLDATSYISIVVIGEIEPAAGAKADMSRLVRWTGYNGGVLALETMMRHISRRAEIELTGRSTIEVDSEAVLAIDALVATLSLAVTESTALDVLTKGRVVQRILEGSFRQKLLSDGFAAQTAATMLSQEETAADGASTGHPEAEVGREAAQVA